MSQKFSRGSEWRKWDLHIHTPLSIVQGFGGDTDEAWGQYISALKELPPEISVLGITDYLFIDGYKKVVERIEEIENIDLILPNIEFRLDLFNAQDKRLNLHVIFDDYKSISPDKIQEQLLNCLSKAYRITDGSAWQQTPTRGSLEELGRQIKDSAPNGNSIYSKSDLQVGFENITYKLEDILKELEKDCFKDKYVLALGYTEWDQFKWNQSAAEKRNVVNGMGFLLTNNLSEETISEHETELRDNSIFKPILYSTDSHDFEQLHRTKLWIKADPTFTGLRQVLNDHDRIFIGGQSPETKNDFEVITNIEISNSSNWFTADFSLPLNKDLVTIIGGRGSGKSALMEMIAYSANTQDPSFESFINKAQKHKESLSGATVCITWGNGETEEKIIGEELNLDEKVQFLPQKAVEELCAPEGNDKLQSQIENVIFNALDETEKYEASTFQELVRNILSEYKIQKDNLKTRIQNQLTGLTTITNEINSLDSKKALLSKLEDKLEKLKGELIKLPGSIEKEQEELVNLLELEMLLREMIIELKNFSQKIDGFEARISEVRKQIVDVKDTLLRDMKSSGFTIEDGIDFDISLEAKSFEEYFEEQRKKIVEEINTLENTDDLSKLKELFPDYEEPFYNYKTVKRKIKEIKGKTKLYESQKYKYQTQKKEILEFTKKIKTLKSGIKNITKELQPQKKDLIKQIFLKYSEVFTILEDERKKLDELYSPLQGILDEGSSLDKLLKFNAEFNYFYKSHRENGLHIIDRTKKGNFKEEGTLGERLINYWNQIKNSDFNETIVETELQKIITEFKLLDEKKISIESQLKNDFTIEDFYSWLFDIDHFSIRTSLLFNDIPLDLLSPGQKGIVLLMLYLAIDNDDKRPLLIDQPEDNLDNLSIYNDVIKYFRNRKLTRQIIVVTHNPNLVVNTDSEQVVVANYDGSKKPRITYKSGSLENHVSLIEDPPEKTGILEEVCNILEGGEKPFKNRRNKYNLSPVIKLDQYS